MFRYFVLEAFLIFSSFIVFPTSFWSRDFFLHHKTFFSDTIRSNAFLENWSFMMKRLINVMKLSELHVLYPLRRAVENIVVWMLNLIDKTNYFSLVDSYSLPLGCPQIMRKMKQGETNINCNKIWQKKFSIVSQVSLLLLFFILNSVSPFNRKKYAERMIQTKSLVMHPMSIQAVHQSRPSN